MRQRQRKMRGHAESLLADLILYLNSTDVRDRKRWTERQRKRGENRENKPKL